MHNFEAISELAIELGLRAMAEKEQVKFLKWLDSEHFREVCERCADYEVTTFVLNKLNSMKLAGLKRTRK